MGKLGVREKSLIHQTPLQYGPIAPSGVTPGTYGDGTNVGQFTVGEDGRITDAESIPISGTSPGGSAGGDLSGTYPNPTVIKNSIAVAQTAHGFSVGMPITNTAANTWAQADQTSSTLACDALVASVVDANNFVAQTVGTMTLTTGQWDSRTGGSGGLTAGEYYWLGGAGLLTKTMPTTGYDQVLFKALSTTVAELEIGDSFAATFYNADISNQRILANISGGTAPAIPNTLSAILANILGNGIAGQSVVGNGAGTFSLGYGIPYGTANPGSPATNDLFWRTDLGLLVFYDGTRWLTTNEYLISINTNLVALAATANLGGCAIRTDFQFYLTRWSVQTFVSSANTGSAFWTIALIRETSAGVDTNISSVSTGTTPDSNATWTQHDQAINAPLDSSAKIMYGKATKTSTPGGLQIASNLYARLIIT